MSSPALLKARKICLSCALGLSLLFGFNLNRPAAAQVFIEQYAPIAETSHVTGPYKRYFRHILKLSTGKYAVLFAPGFADLDTARRAVSPLCAGQAPLVESGPLPVDLVYEKGEAKILHAIHIHCG